MQTPKSKGIQAFFIPVKKNKKIFIETYGCQMNFSDSEIVASVLSDKQFEITTNINEAGVILINTCSIRDHAEQRIRHRLNQLSHVKRKKPGTIIGVIGCMAERLKEKLLEEEHMVDLILGPDAYRSLPLLLEEVEAGQKGINVLLSNEETYADINPVRYNSNGVSAFISIMRGCENFCSYCVVPFTRGKERSRDPETIINESRNLFNNGYKEITLLGQNVNSYKWKYDTKEFSFSDLLEQIALINPLLRLRFATSHPKDIPDELLHIIAKYPNIARSVHLPVQSGSSKILQMMNRKYTREIYLERIEAIKKIIPDCTVSTDIITGFCSETEEDFQETVSLMKEAAFEFAYMFKYSERPDTTAQKKFKDDIPEEIKTKRLDQIISLQRDLSHESNKKDVGKIFEVLIDSVSKRSKDFYSGRNSQNKVVIIPRLQFAIGDYARVKIMRCTSATLFGEIV